MTDKQNDIVASLNDMADYLPSISVHEATTLREAADEIKRLRKYEAGIKDLASKACLEECDRHDRLRLSGICAPCWARRIEFWSAQAAHQGT